MNTLAADTAFVRPVRLERPRMRPLAAFKAFRNLMQDKDNTTYVFQLMQALSGSEVPKGYSALLRDAEGARQAFQAAELVECLGDKTWLAQFGDGTLGAAYLEFMRVHGFSADGLVASEAEAAKSTALVEHPHAWYARRIRDLHDVWHVLTGYDTDALGEACIVAFSFAQTRQLGFAVIALGGAQEMRRDNRSVPTRKAVLEAYRTGRRARRLVGLDYERLFALPLETARRELSIGPATVYASIPEATRRQLLVRTPKANDGQPAMSAMH